MTNREKAAAAAKRLRRFFGHFPQVAANLERIEQLFDYQCDDEEPEHIMLLGDPGTGKSTLLKRVVKQHPRVAHDDFTEVPVLYVQVPSNCTIKSLAGAMLLAMASPFWNKGTEEDRTFQLRTLLVTCRVRLIILDEINHAVDRGQSTSHKSVADWIKQLSTQVGVSLVLGGIRRSQQLLNANDQFADRFREVLELEPLGVGTKSQRDEFYRVMEAFEAVLEGVSHVDLKTDSMLAKLAFCTGGRLRDIRRLLVRSVELAGREPTLHIDGAVIERAFLQVIFKRAKPDQNPFSAMFRGLPLIQVGEPYAPTVDAMEV